LYILKIINSYIFVYIYILINFFTLKKKKDPVKKSILSDCIKKRNHIIELGEKNTSGSHDVPSPVILSGTRVKFIYNKNK
jgi:hypothetical protein